jgi:hypothetical protein
MTEVGGTYERISLQWLYGGCFSTLRLAIDLGMCIEHCLEKSIEDIETMESIQQGYKAFFPLSLTPWTKKLECYYLTKCLTSLIDAGKVRPYPIEVLFVFFTIV